MSTVHKNLTGADLHEPKGADTATSGKVYVSDGAGSGVWTDASTIITNTAFTTGDLKPTHKVTADSGWIMWSDLTIGDGSSSATARANADTVTLFTLYWNNYSNTLCPIYTSAGSVSTRGASAALDYAAHKRLALPTILGRALGVAGAGSGLTSRTVGSTLGAETYTLLLANLPAYTPSGSISGSGTLTSFTALSTAATASAGTSMVVSNAAGGGASLSNVSGSVTVTSTFTGTAQGGTSTAFNIMNPMAYVNVMIKL